MPNINELHSLVDYSTFYPSINTNYFLNDLIGTAFYWSSTESLWGTGITRGVVFTLGYDSNFYKTSSTSVRAVREGQSIAPPQQNSPGMTIFSILGFVDLNKPTVVLTHGLSDESDLSGAPDTLWIGSKEKQASKLINQETGGEVNIIQYIWEDGFQAGYFPTAVSYNKAQPYVYAAGYNLAQKLKEFLGPTYNRKIHFIGHSLGTIVNACAARIFLEEVTTVKTAQFTALDRPDHVNSNIPGCVKCKGFDENFFGEIFKDVQTKPGRDLDLVIDNYYSLEGTGVGDKTNGQNVYNHDELIEPNVLDDVIFDNEGAINNHSGVHQWYRWTINPNGLYPDTCNSQTGGLLNLPSNFDDSLDPCNKGWKWSIARSNPLPFPQTEDKPVTTKKSILPFIDYNDYGCQQTPTATGTKISCKETSPSNMQLSPLEIAKAGRSGCRGFL